VANFYGISARSRVDALCHATANAKQDVLQALIDHGARVDGPRGSALTPLMLAARANNVDSLKVLIDNGANVARKCKLPWAENRTAEGLAELERRTKALTFLREL
jgi:ankyrin repeat protein